MDKEKIREEREYKAKRHSMKIELMYSDITSNSAKSSVIYNDSNVDISNSYMQSEKTENVLVANNVETVLEAICKGDRKKYGKVAVLNFASYKHPGGGYIRGMLAQEEALCHISGLYNVLIKREDFYANHKNTLNKGLYTNHALYSPGVPFIFGDYNEQYFIDVITCAAPNLSPVQRYNTATIEECYNAMDRRIEFIFKIAMMNNVETLILGAFGCGVFKNDPRIVASLIRYYSEKYNGCFKYIIHPIPNDLHNPSSNYVEFEKVFKDTKFNIIEEKDLVDKIIDAPGKNIIVFKDFIDFHVFSNEHPGIVARALCINEVNNRTYKFMKAASGTDSTGIICMIGCNKHALLLDNCDTVYFYNYKFNNISMSKGNYLTVPNGTIYYVQ